MVLTEPAVVRRPAVFTIALTLVRIGVAIAAVDLVGNTAGLYTLVFAWREHTTHFGAVLVLLAVPTAASLAGLAATVHYLRQAGRASRSGRIGLATLMFCFVPGAVVNYSLTEIFFLFWALSDWSSGGNSAAPDWAAAVLGGSMIADALLLLIALTAGILLVLPPSARYTAVPTGPMSSRHGAGP